MFNSNANLLAMYRRHWYIRDYHEILPQGRGKGDDLGRSLDILFLDYNSKTF